MKKLMDSSQLHRTFQLTSDNESLSLSVSMTNRADFQCIISASGISVSPDVSTRTDYRPASRSWASNYGDRVNVRIDSTIHRIYTA